MHLVREVYYWIRSNPALPVFRWLTKPTKNPWSETSHNGLKQLISHQHVRISHLICLWSVTSLFCVLYYLG